MTGVNFLRLGEGMLPGGISLMYGSPSDSGLQGKMHIFSDPILFHLGPFPVTQTMASSLAVSVFLLAVALLMRQVVRRNPMHGLSILAILIVQWLEHLVQEIIGRPEPQVTTWAGSLFLFIAVCNVSGLLPGVHPATANLSTTSALALIVFLAVPIAGIHRRGLRSYVKHYFQPNPLLFPLHVISEISRTFALSVRLFGNIMSGHMIIALLVSLGGFLVPLPFMALKILIGLLQAYIFTVLSIVYIGAAIERKEEP